MVTSDRAFALLLVLFAAAASLLYGLYLFRTMQQFVDFDQYQYYWNIRRSLTGSRPLPIFNPHHLHLEFLSERFHNHVVELLGDAGFTDLAFNLRLRSLVTATAGLFLFMLLIGVLTRGVGVALLSGAALGFSHGYIFYATKIDTAIFPTVGLIAVLVCVLWVDRGGRLWPVAALSLAVAMFLAVMAHVYMGIACAVAGVALLMPSARRLPQMVRPFVRTRVASRLTFRNRHLRRVIATVGAGALALGMIAGAYVFVGRGVYNLPYAGRPDTGSRDLFRGSTFQEWLFLYEVVSDAWGYGIEQFSPDQPIRGYTDAFLTRTSSYRTYGILAPFEYDLSHIDDPDAFPFNVLAVVTIATLAGAVLLFPMLLRRYGRPFLAVFGMVPPFFLFFTYWEPSYLEFWLVPTVLVVALLSLMVNLLAEAAGSVIPAPAGVTGCGAADSCTRRPAVPRGVRYALSRLTAALVLGAFAVTLAVHNIDHYVIPFSRLQLREGLPASWTEEAITPLYSSNVYRRPIEERRSPAEP